MAFTLVMTTYLSIMNNKIMMCNLNVTHHLWAEVKHLNFNAHIYLVRSTQL